MPPAKRKRSNDPAKALLSSEQAPPPLKRRASSRTVTTAATTNPDRSADVIDAPDALRASPDSDVNADIVPGPIRGQTNVSGGDSPLSDAPEMVEPPAPAAKRKGRPKNAATGGVENAADGDIDTSKLKTPAKKGRAQKADAGASIADVEAPATATKKKPNEGAGDPEAEGDEDADPEEIKEALSRPPPVNSNYLPLPWKGRLGYCCLNTYLRNSNPPIFSSRTCRIQSILEHRHPLQDPTQPEHASKNRPDKDQPANVALGQKYVEELGLANVKDIIKMVRWNDRYHIKFFRLSSEMFPFASHPEYGYKLAPFASEALAEAGKVIAQLGHRVTTHPGQFTQLGSPRHSVIDNALRDLEYHDEMLSLLKLPPQMNKDAVMIMHMGGLFEGKAETLQRFRENYVKLKQSVKNRLVLENDDVIWSVHDLLPVCEELNIPLVLDYHHHNIIFDSDKIREGTKDIMDLYPRITATWTRKGIKQKMHYSEPTPQAITGRQRRKHSPRVASLPPCAPDMDLMIEAKDKEQAVFELMRIFKLPGYDAFNDILPYTRNDDNKMALQAMNRKKKKEGEPGPELVPEKDIGMGGPEGRVYWPPTMEEWLRPKKKEVKKKDPTKAAMKKKAKSDAEKAAVKTAIKQQEAEAKAANKAALAAAKATVKKTPKAKKEVQPVPTPSSSEASEEGPELNDEDDEVITSKPRKAATASRPAVSRTTSRRSAKGKVNYNEDQMEE
ncbi:hypothetical protein CERZMDRAFT_37035 [Cercospora zeae-maydis SCOH1-5]|uniref:UV-endonuclease UvdE n=1 Tax=Cercospora zeae-maydis SCOH1-5 TaxID=717836 RepID=A0A6A6FN71_9PEZI|nr:hypothetical protein CERZMDRAFT_37035 [Cercospora zeae-maydis SCOH1-5]